MVQGGAEGEAGGEDKGEDGEDTRVPADQRGRVEVEDAGEGQDEG